MIVNPDGYIVDEDGTVLDEAPFDYEYPWMRYRYDEKMRLKHAEEINDLPLHTTFRARNLRDEKLLKALRKVIDIQSRRLRLMIAEIMTICSNEKLPTHVCSEAIAIGKKIVSVPKSVEELAEIAVYGAAARHGYVVRRKAKVTWLQRRGIHIVRDMKRTMARLVDRVVNELGLPAKVTILAMRIYEVNRERFAGAAPSSIAAALVYIAARISDIEVKQDVITKKLGVNSSAIRLALAKGRITVAYVVDTGTLRMKSVWKPSSGMFNGIVTPSEVAAKFAVKEYETSINVKRGEIEVIIRALDVFGDSDGFHGALAIWR